MSLIPPVSAAAPRRRAVPAPRWAPLWFAARLGLGLVVTAWSLLLIAWLLLHWGILPHIQQWRGEIEARASQALGVPVRIGNIEVRSSGWVPAFELRDVRLLDAQQRTALALPRVMAAISPRSLLALELRFAQLLIDGAQLEIRRDAQGRIFVAGLPLEGATAGAEGGAADWFFKQSEVVIRGGSLRWTDEQRAAPPLVLGDVQLVVRNRLHRHDIRLDATPPASWGDRFTLVGRFGAPLLAQRGDWRHWSGAAYASLPRADVRELRQHVALPFELSEGKGALRGWFELERGQLRGATVDLALRAVSLRLDASVDPIAFERIDGRLTATRDDQGVALAARHFSFVTGDAIAWPQGDMSLAWRQREGEAASGGAFNAERLDIGLMARIASRIPLATSLRALLADLKPEGMVSGLAASWTGAADAPDRYRAKGRVSGLSVAARPSADPRALGRPGVRNADLLVDANEAGGTARLAIASGEIDLPGVFEQALVPLEQLSAQLSWKIEPVASKSGKKPSPNPAPPRITLQVKDAVFSNADAQGRLNANWSTGAGSGVARGGRYPGRLELDGRLTNGIASRVARYLPLALPEATRSYVERAVLGGTLSTASFRVKGELWDFPFHTAHSARDSEFRIAAQVADLGFAYVPEPPTTRWPALEHVNGELIIDRGSLEIRNAQALLGGVAWSRVQGGIRTLAEHSVLTLDAVGRGPLAGMLHYVDATPIAGWLGNALLQASGGGAADLKLALDIPLAKVSSTHVKGSLLLGGNDVRITPESPLLASAKGQVDFDEKGFTVTGAAARVYGGELSFEGGSQADGGIRFAGSGNATVDGLRRAAEPASPLARAAGVLSGQAAYRVNLGFVHGESEITVTSNLVGLAIKLPAPLNKAADAPLALRYQTTLAPESLASGQAPRDTLRVEIGTLVQAQYLRDLSGEVGPRVLRGGVGVMEAAPLPRGGVAAHITLPALDLDAWQAAAEQLLGPAATAYASAADTPGYVPDSFALHVQELKAGSRRLNKLVAGISQDAGLWRANLDAEQLNGYVEYRPARPGAAGRVYARLARLSLPKSDVDQVESLLDQQQPASVPALDVVVDDFELRGKHLGRVELEALNRATGEGRDAGREWRLSKFSLSLPEAQLTGTGSWSATGPAAGRNTAPAPRRAVMDFKLALGDSGALLDRLGTGHAIKGGKGQMSGTVSWLGSPFTLDYASLAGQINVAVAAGQFLKADPGAARLLGVLSLQSLPRRLALDFRDLFQEGFAFDNINGDVTIGEGVARTNNLRMRGVQAAVLMEGRADIERETQDLRVVVVPEINAGTASLAYAVINPAIGLGTFLAQALLRKPLIAAGTREFHVSGPWADPKVEPIERKFGAAVPVLDAPAAAASAPQPNE